MSNIINLNSSNIFNNLYKTDNSYLSILDAIQKEASLKEVQTLLTIPTFRNEINSIKDDEGKNALILAIELGDDKIVSALLQNGADPNSVDSKGLSALHWAICLGAELDPLPIMRLLIDHQADLEIGKGSATGTPLHQAIKFGNKEATQLLLKFRANVSALNSKGLTPLHKAAKDPTGEMLALLLPVAETLDPGEGSLSGTPLHEACRSQNTAVAKKLLSQGAYAHAKDAREITPLLIALDVENEEIFDLLLGRTSKVDIKSSGKALQQILLSNNNPSELFKVLLLKLISKAGPDLLTVSTKGRSLLRQLIELDAEIFLPQFYEKSIHALTAAYKNLSEEKEAIFTLINALKYSFYFIKELVEERESDLEREEESEFDADTLYAFRPEMIEQITSILNLILEMDLKSPLYAFLKKPAFSKVNIIELQKEIVECDQALTSLINLNLLVEEALLKLTQQLRDIQKECFEKLKKIHQPAPDKFVSQTDCFDNSNVFACLTSLQLGFGSNPLETFTKIIHPQFLPQHFSLYGLEEGRDLRKIGIDQDLSELCSLIEKDSGKLESGWQRIIEVAKTKLHLLETVDKTFSGESIKIALKNKGKLSAVQNFERQVNLLLLKRFTSQNPNQFAEALLARKVDCLSKLSNIPPEDLYHFNSTLGKRKREEITQPSADTV